MNGLPLHNDGELPSFSSLPSFSFWDLMNDSNRDLTLQNLFDVLNPANKARRDEYKNLAKKKMPEIENRQNLLKFISV